MLVRRPGKVPLTDGTTPNPARPTESAILTGKGSRQTKLGTDRGRMSKKDQKMGDR